MSYKIARSMRDVLVGGDVPVSVTQRAAGVLAGLRSDAIGRVYDGGLVISRGDLDLRWWTWAGYRVNATLKATIGELADELQRSLVDQVKDRLCLPEIDEKALAGLKFSDALPRHLAEATLAARLADLDHARSVLLERVRFER